MHLIRRLSRWLNTTQIPPIESPGTGKQSNRLALNTGQPGHDLKLVMSRN